MKIEVSEKAPQGFKDLAWDVFFASRNRGISLGAHFPFLNSDKGFYVTITVDGNVIAGLAVNPVTRQEGRFVAGLVGLVCVHPTHRGVGHSTAMLQAAIDHARRLEMDDLILWTGKPRVYQKLGFETFDNGVFGSVTRNGPSSGSQAGAVRSPWPDEGDPRGLPPFAVGAHRWANAYASIIVLEDANGTILAEWSGPDERVLDIINQVMPEQWRINAFKDDGLLGLLESGDWKLSLQPANLQMIMNLHKRTGEVDPYRLRMLSRI